jgi:hypothetical protein
MVTRLLIHQPRIHEMKMVIAFWFTVLMALTPAISSGQEWRKTFFTRIQQPLPIGGGGLGIWFPINADTGVDLRSILPHVHYVTLDGRTHMLCILDGEIRLPASDEPEEAEQPQVVGSCLSSPQFGSPPVLMERWGVEKWLDKTLTCMNLAGL